MMRAELAHWLVLALPPHRLIDGRELTIYQTSVFLSRSCSNENSGKTTKYQFVFVTYSVGQAAVLQAI